MTEAAAPVRPPKALNARRSFWLKQLHQWHWISAALSLIGLLLFAVTGITLNHASQIPAEPVTVERTATLPAPLLERLEAFPAETTDPVPAAVARWASGALNVQIVVEEVKVQSARRSTLAAASRTRLLRSSSKRRLSQRRSAAIAGAATAHVVTVAAAVTARESLRMGGLVRGVSE